jgi:hypothetical protein
MVALTRYFHVIGSRVAAGLSAVLLSGRHIAETGYVCALSSLVVHNSFLSFRFVAFCSFLEYSRLLNRLQAGLQTSQLLPSGDFPKSSVQPE